jgi:glycosyltransferase involved in cell wall biosynthesis
VPGRVGGSETYVRGLLSELGDEVTVFPNSRPERSDLGRLVAMTYGMTVGPRLRDPGVDVLHYPLTVPVPRFDGPTVVTLHDLQHLELRSFFSSAERAFRRFAYEGAARRASVVVTPSSHARAMAAERLGIDPARVVVAPHGVDHSRFTASGPSEGPGRFLIYPANLWPHKNHSRLVEGLARAADRSISLVLTGTDYGRLDALLAQAERLGVRDRVHHLGFVSHDTLPALLRGARGMVFPSLFEGFGQPPLEAMACGCAVASSVRGALGEVCSGAVHELDPLDVNSIALAIDALAFDDALVGDLRERGLERAASFTWARSAQAHREAYALAERRR